MISEGLISKIVITGIILVACIFIWNKFNVKIKDAIGWAKGKIYGQTQQQQPQSFGGGYEDPNETDYFKLWEQRNGRDPFYDD
jgi:hypothetical protein